MRHDDPDAYQVGPSEPLPFPASVVVAALSPLVTEARLARMQHVVANRTKSVVVVLEDLTDPHNGSAVMRSADAFGVQEVHVVPSQHGFSATRTVSKGAHKWLTVTRHRSTPACVEALHARGFEVLVAAMDGALTPEDVAKRRKVALVFGNEHRGASEAMREGADGTFAIPMVGFVESLNVSVAAAVTLYTATRGRGGDLDDAEREGLLARYLFDSVRDAARVVAEHAATGR
jgi:tRNA (guanosine-2'-O-)-methyltransferase